MIIQLMGPQACGKGTQGKLLSKELDLPLVGVGESLRNISKDYPKYDLVVKELNSGELVDFDIVADVIKHEVAKPAYINGYILDGWGRILDQLTFFDPKPDIVIYISLPYEESIRRITGRRTCQPTGEIINLNTMSAEEIAKCPGPLIQREDETEDAVKRRLEIFRHDTMPVIEKYRKEGILIEIDGTPNPQQVFSNILKALELRDR